MGGINFFLGLSVPEGGGPYVAPKDGDVFPGEADLRGEEAG